MSRCLKSCILKLGIAVLTACLWSLPSIAVGSDPSHYHCFVQTLQAISQPLSEARLFSEAELAQITEWSTLKKISAQEFNERVMGLYLERRLQLLPEGDREAIRRLLGGYEIKQEDRLAGFYRERDHFISVSTPLVEDQALSHGILSHELEHLIQYYYFRKAPRTYMNYTLAGKLHPKWVQMKFELEKGAMTAEWQYLKTIPRETRQHMLHEVQQLAQLSDSQKRLAERILLNPDLPLEEYLKLEWGFGRYSQSQISTIALKQRATVVALPTSVSMVISCLGLRAHFSQEELKKMSYYQWVCLGKVTSALQESSEQSLKKIAPW